MTTRDNKIIALPNNHLRHRSQKVGLITDDIRQIIEDMKAATLTWEDSRKYELGVALSAVQIDKLYRIFILREDLENKQNRTFSIFINPVITKYEGKIVEDFEGCLSVKDIYGRVPRFEQVRIKATDINGHEFRLTAQGFIARVLQHEIDHINGKLFIDQIKDNPEAFFSLGSDGKLNEIDYEKVIKKSSLFR